MPIADNQARVQITYQGEQGDLPDPVPYDAAEGDIKQWVAEALRAGDVPGITQPHAEVNLQNFMVQKFASNEEIPFNRIAIRPKTAFGRGQ